MDVSIIYVNYKTADLIVDSIHTVKTKTQGVSYEIIVVDNQSGDDSVRRIRQACPDVRIIESEENLGFGRANNLGMQVASGNAFFFLNPDTWLLNNAIALLYDFLRDHPRVGACGGNLVDEEGNPVNSFGRFYPSLWEELLSVFYLKPYCLRHARSLRYNFTGRPLPVASIVGADLMVKREVVQQTGGFDPDFFMNYEETEWCLRMHRAGYAIVSVPEARIVHLEGKASYVSVSRVQRFYEGQYVFFSKRYGPGGARQLFRLVDAKCRLRKLQFRLLGKPDKIAYWETKQQANRQAYRQIMSVPE